MRAKTSALFSLVLLVGLIAVAVYLLVLRVEAAKQEQEAADVRPAIAAAEATPETTTETTTETENIPPDETAPPDETELPSETAPPDETEPPSETAPPDETAFSAGQDPHVDPVVHEQPEPAPEGYFADAAFLGSSVVTGLSMYDYDGILAGSTFYAANSVTVLGISSYLDQMQGHVYGKVYVGLGTNEMSYNKDELRARFVDMIDRLRSFNPDCVIYLMTVPPVSQYKSNTSSSFTKLLVLDFNQMLFDIAREQGVWYLDVYSALCDEDGYLPSDVTADGVHFSAEHYQYWFDLLNTHYIP